MFTWICPKCGKEVPPHESECPYCHGTGKVEAPAAAGQQAPPPPQPPQQPGHYFQQPPPPPQHQPPAAPPQYAPPPPPQQYAPPPAPQQYATPPAPPQPAPPAYSAAPQQPPAHQGYVPPPAGPPPGEQQYYEVGGGHRKGLPGWAVMILVALVAVGLGYVLYTYVLPSNQSPSMKGGETPVAGEGKSTPSVEAARLARHLEATGFRISEDSQQRAQVQFLIINHSAADIGNLAGFVNLRVHDGSPNDPPLSQVEFKTDKLGPYESIEFKTTIETGLRAYEMPDWQFLRADVEVTSPTSAE